MASNSSVLLRSRGSGLLPGARRRRELGRSKSSRVAWKAVNPRDTPRAMSEENVEVVRKAIAYEYYGVGDRAEADAIFRPDVVMNPLHVMDEEPSYGPSAMRDDWERWASAFEELNVTFEELIDAGDRVVVVVSHHQGREHEEAGSRSMPASTRSIRCARERSRVSMSTPSGRKPSKPPGCGSSRFRRRAGISAAATLPSASRAEGQLGLNCVSRPRQRPHRAKERPGCAQSARRAPRTHLQRPSSREAHPSRPRGWSSQASRQTDPRCELQAKSA